MRALPGGCLLRRSRCGEHLAGKRTAASVCTWILAPLRRPATKAAATIQRRRQPGAFRVHEHFLGSAGASAGDPLSPLGNIFLIFVHLKPRRILNKKRF